MYIYKCTHLRLDLYLLPINSIITAVFIRRIPIFITYFYIHLKIVPKNTHIILYSNVGNLEKI